MTCSDYIILPRLTAWTFTTYLRGQGLFGRGSWAWNRFSCSLCNFQFFGVGLHMFEAEMIDIQFPSQAWTR